MLEGILEESWTYQKIYEKGRLLGLELGRLLAREEEYRQRVHEKHQFLVNIVQLRFPELMILMKVQTWGIDDPEVLHNLISRLFTVQTAEEAKQVLMELKPEEE